jgi:hypothetical protein
MPIDSGIYAAQQPFRLNTPFETLGQIAQLQQHQQVLQSAKTLDQERQAKLAEDAKKQQEADTFNSIIGNPAITRDALLEQIRVKSPEHYLGALKSFQDLDKSAADYDKLKADAADANAKAQEGMQKVIGTVANGIAAHNYAPAAFEAGLKELEGRFPAFAPTAQNYRQLALQGGPDWIKEHVEGLRTMADRSTAAKLPGEAAQSAIQTQVAAGTVGGLTPEQQAYGANQQAQRGQEQQRIGIEAARLKVEQDKAKALAETKAAGKPLPAMEADKISEFDKGISAIRDLRESIATGSTGGLAQIEAKLVPNALADIVPGAAAAKATQADIVRAQQVVGRLIHGGVMRANDAAAAAQYMPQIGDSKSVIKSKLDKAEAAGLKTRADHVGNLGKSGYDVSNFAAVDTAESPAATAPKLAAGKVSRVVQDGVTYQVVTDPQGKVISAKPVP